MFEFMPRRHLRVLPPNLSNRQSSNASTDLDVPFPRDYSDLLNQVWFQLLLFLFYFNCFCFFFTFCSHFSYDHFSAVYFSLCHFGGFATSINFSWLFISCVCVCFSHFDYRFRISSLESLSVSFLLLVAIFLRSLYY